MSSVSWLRRTPMTSKSSSAKHGKKKSTFSVAALSGLAGTLFLEFDVPRLGSRIDAVLVSGSAVFPIEFKCGERQFRLADYNQAWDYALDLKNFHAASHEAPNLSNPRRDASRSRG